MLKLISVLIFVIAPSVWAQESLCSPLNQINPTQEPSDRPQCRIVGDTFYLEGVISEAFLTELRDFHPKIRHLELNSFGGSASAAYKIAALVREKKITTNVRKDAKCASSCTLVFQAGVKRSAHPLVRFLFNGARFPNFSVSSKVREQLLFSAETVKFFKQLLFYGMHSSFIDYYRKLPEFRSLQQKGTFSRAKQLIIESGKLIDYNIVQEFDFRSEVDENEIIPFRI